MLYYLRKLEGQLKNTFSLKRLKKFGLRIAILDFISFLCHRSASAFQLAVIRSKDRIVQKYLYKNYGEIISKYREK